MDARFTLSIITFFYLLLTIVVYFFKDRISSIDNKMYSKLLLIAFLSVVFETLCNISVLYFPDTIYSDIIGRLYMITIVIWFIIFSVYICSMTIFKKYSLDDYLKSTVRKVYVAIGTVSALMILVLPLNFHLNSYQSYIDGVGVVFLAFVVIMALLFDLIIYIYKFNNLSIKERIPMIALFLLIIFLIIMHKFVPQIQFVSSVLSFLSVIMFFTIENPDMRMLRQTELAKEQADKANKAKTDFLSSMSHEIRTPLNAIVGFSDCVMESGTLEEAKENAKDIVNASQTLLEIVNGILDISKIEAGKLEIANTPYNAPEVFEELAKLITPKMNEKGLDFTYRIAPDLPKSLVGDHTNIKKIVTNLLSNACKYTDHGYVHYEVNCINTGNVSKVIISVEDSGRGIKRDTIDKMFTKFQRFEEDRNTTIEGTGLGLAITKQLIELMGGRIIVHTVYGEGSKFTVVINQKISNTEVLEKKNIKDTLDLHDVRILLVDDNQLNLKVACKLLEKYNANQLETCNSGFECLDKIKNGRVYDLILLDDMMPKMNGVETLQKLKEIPGFNIPTIALTANAISGMREEYLADGFTDYLAKPIEKEQLVLVLNQVLGRSITENLPVPNVVEEETISNGEKANIDDSENNEDNNNNSDIIPVEDNIEEILGNQLERNYVDERNKILNTQPIEYIEGEISVDSDTNVQPIDPVESIENQIPLRSRPVEIQHIEPIEELEEEKPKENLNIDLVPVVDINPSIETSEKVYDRSFLEENGVDVNHALELLGDMDMYNYTIHDFIAGVEEKWNRIVDYKNNNNMKDYAIEVHSLKSDCKYLGFMKLADISYQHELKSKENDSTFVQEHFAELENEYNAVLKYAKEYVEHNPVQS